MDIGYQIHEELRRQGKTPTWLAQEIHMSRTNLYYIFSHKSINTDLLMNISRVLQHDFFKDYSEEYCHAPINMGGV